MPNGDIRSVIMCRYLRVKVLGLVAEGAMYDWSVLYLRESLASPQALAGTGLCGVLGGDGHRPLRG